MDAPVRHTSERIAIPPICCGHIDRCTEEVNSQFDAYLHACHPRLVNGYPSEKNAGSGRKGRHWFNEKREFDSLARIRHAFGSVAVTRESAWSFWI